MKMSSLSNVQPAEGGRSSHQKALLSPAILTEVGEGHLELEENEDEDVDFNPFLKGNPSSEASSSLSSENEGLGADVVDNVTSSSAPYTTNLSSNLTDKVHDFASRDSENDEEVVMQTRLSPEGSCGEESEAGVQQKPKKRKLAVTFQRETEAVPGKENTSIFGTDAVGDFMRGEFPDPRNPRTSVVDVEEEDAICRRTRARYSLANFTLDELETFLQESDDDADPRYADDEEEYRKFLAAVLQGGDSESQAIQEKEIVDDEDEDEDEENDADFEIEIEEALESDLDESQPGKGQKSKHEGVGRRPETRQNRRQKSSVHGKRNLLGLAKRPLRPLLPFVPNTQLSPFPALDLPRETSETSPHFSSSSAQSGLINGFTRHQIGQLYCLIHEHMQLLIQVFSLCVLEPSRQHITREVQEMISEMVHKHDEVLAWRNVPYPGFCFHPSCIHSSVSEEFPQFYQGGNTVDSSFASNARNDLPSTNNMMPASHSSSQSVGRIQEHAQVSQVDTLKTAESPLWVPLIRGPVLSVLDVAPLRLVGGYVVEVATAVKKYQQRHVEGVSASPFEKEPLFPLPSFPPVAESNSEVLRGPTPQGPNTSSPPGPQQPKKTLAATIVESTKKQSVALVQRDIVKLVQRFFPLFNSALFPHKPPPVAVANRVLFTDAEDELLALGLMEYNTDWKAIQQRFLPCKSKHQIFVRQKNRCSSKAPENPIKAVRRMKTSPLTAEEKARINEGLRVFKLDWMSIWKFIVPYRDPSLLPRQWRVALGTQKSYKSDAAKKEKRRVYESMRRKSKTAGISCWQTASEKEDYPVDNAYGGNNSGDDNLDDEDEAYVHEAFLADWRPGNSRLIYSELPQSSFSKGAKSGDLSPQEGACVGGKLAGVGDGYGETQSNQAHLHEFLPASIYSQHLQNASPFTSARYDTSNIMASNHLASDLVSKSAKKQVHLRPCRVRRSNSLQLVKLAPDLPPVNLPPSVRVISQSAFKSYCSGSSYSTKTCTAGGGGEIGNAAGTEDQVPRLNIARSATTHSVNAGKNRTFSINHNTSNPSKVSGLPVDQHVAGEKRAELDLQMHPLLFQAPEDGCFPYYPLNCGTTSGNLSLLPGNQLQANFDLFCKPQSVGQTPPTPGSIEFHPLLQKTDDVSGDSVPALSACRRSVDLESLHGHCAQAQQPETSVLSEPQVRSSLSASATIPASPSDRNSELDLEIHLSSTSRKEKVMTDRAITEPNSNDLEISGADCGTTMRNRSANGPSYQGSSPHYHAVSVASKYSSKGGPQGACPLVPASSSLSGYAEDITEQQSPQEIVMEQEELSDSDEELGENVEFECEEMADSDGEGSDFEQFVNLQNKEASSAVVEEDVSNADHESEQGLQTDAHDTEGDTRSCKSGLSNKVGDASSEGAALLVSLDSQALGQSTCSKPKFKGGGKGDDQIGRSYSQNGLPPRPSRSCKRMTPNSSMELHHLDIPNPQHVGNAEGAVVFTPGTKPRKRVPRSNYTKGDSNCKSSDNTVDRRTEGSCPKVEDDVRNATPMCSNALQTGGDARAQGLKEVQESKPQL
ncbi:uncharacterized protein LOC122076494 [Macadamia integrifolia]|uniref:uncharacterized protein LOC122076494 n=1 Tax=Macadamia integrifolia TaxID=60698 RepID=UPI001C4FE477|nr:uncharacterized protein LOC122076494 [Macadamia integrifolia]